MIRERLLDIIHMKTDSSLMYLQKLRFIIESAGKDISYKECSKLIDEEVIKWKMMLEEKKLSG